MLDGKVPLEFLDMRQVKVGQKLFPIGVAYLAPEGITVQPVTGPSLLFTLDEDEDYEKNTTGFTLRNEEGTVYVVPLDPASSMFELLEGLTYEDVVWRCEAGR